MKSIQIASLIAVLAMAVPALGAPQRGAARSRSTAGKPHAGTAATPKRKTKSPGLGGSRKGKKTASKKTAMASRRHTTKKREKAAGRRGVATPTPSRATRSGDSLIDALRPVIDGVAFIDDQGTDRINVVARSPDAEAAIRRVLRANPAVSVETTGTFVGGEFRSIELYSLERSFPGGGSRQVTINVRQAVQGVLN